MELIMAFAFGLVTGFICGVVPDLIRHYSYTKHLTKLGDVKEEEYIRVDAPEDPDDQKEREKNDEARIGFW